MDRGSRLNAQAPEFVPTTMMMRHPVVHQPDESCVKLLNQVEYYFSDLNLATTDHLMRFISKDPNGFVPISVVASFKKIKALSNGHAHLATVLRTSSKLVVSPDGKRVRRLNPITDAVMEDLQSRIIVAENLPDDHCHQNLMKIFSAVGSVKTIRTCPPQSPPARSPKSDNMHFTNKLHAFVEYECVEVAEKAVTELNDVGNWRSGLRVRLMGRHVAQARGRKGHDGDAIQEEDDACSSSNGKQAEDALPQHSDYEHVDHGNEKQRKGRGRGRGRGRGQNHTLTAPSIAEAKQQSHPPGPRMPDGTRGFAMGRGKPVVAVNTC